MGTLRQAASEAARIARTAREAQAAEAAAAEARNAARGTSEATSAAQQEIKFVDDVENFVPKAMETYPPSLLSGRPRPFKPFSTRQIGESVGIKPTETASDATSRRPAKLAPEEYAKYVEAQRKRRGQVDIPGGREYTPAQEKVIRASKTMSPRAGVRQEDLNRALKSASVASPDLSLVRQRINRELATVEGAPSLRHEDVVNMVTDFPEELGPLVRTRLDSERARALFSLESETALRHRVVSRRSVTMGPKGEPLPTAIAGRGYANAPREQQVSQWSRVLGRDVNAEIERTAIAGNQRIPRGTPKEAEAVIRAATERVVMSPNPRTGARNTGVVGHVSPYNTDAVETLRRAGAAGLFATPFVMGALGQTTFTGNTDANFGSKGGSRH